MKFLQFFITTVLPIIDTDGFFTFGCFSVKKSEIKFKLGSLKSLTNSKTPSRNPLQRACCAIQKVAYAYDSKVVPKAAFDCKNFSESRLQYNMSTGENRPMREKESPNRNTDLEQFFELISVFTETSRNFTFIVHFNKAAYTYINHAHVQEVLI